MICHHHKCVFVHIPKTAGQSIENVFLDSLNLTWETRAPLLLRYNDVPELGPPRLAHLKADDYVRYNYLTQQMYDDYFTFAYIRNPWGRMISMYKYFGFNEKCDFKTFLMGPFKTIFKEKYWFVGSQTDFIYDHNDKLRVDFVGRFETLQEDFYCIGKKLNLPVSQLPHINKSNDIDPGLSSSTAVKIPAMHKEKRSFPVYRSYQDYYDQESIDLVGDIYKKDIDVFKYDFEQRVNT